MNHSNSPNITTLATFVNSNSTISLNALTSHCGSWIHSIETAALLCIEFCGSDKDGKMLKAGYTLLCQHAQDTSYLNVGQVLSTRFLQLHSANQFQRASRVLTACIECVLKSPVESPKPSKTAKASTTSSCTSTVSTTAIVRAVEQIPFFVSTLALCLCNFGVSRPASKFIEHVLVHYLNVGSTEGACGWVRVLVRSHLTLSDPRDPKQVDDLMTMLAQLLRRLLRRTNQTEHTLRFQQNVWSIVWKIRNEHALPHSPSIFLSRTLSCLRLCAAVDDRMSLGALLESDSDATKSIGRAAMSGLTGQDTSHLARLQALELCCAWLSANKKFKKKSKNNKLTNKRKSQMGTNVDDGTAVALSSIEVWVLASTPTISNFFTISTTADNNGMPGNFIQRLKTTLSTLLASCPALRPTIVRTICLQLNCETSPQHGRLLLSLLMVPRHARKTHWTMSLPSSTLDDVKRCGLNVMQNHAWSELRQMACDVLLSLGSYAHLLTKTAAATTTTTMGNNTTSATKELNHVEGAAADASSLLVALEYDAECGKGGTYRVEVEGTVSLLSIVQHGLDDGCDGNGMGGGGVEDGQKEKHLHLVEKAVSTLLALPVDALLPFASEFVAGACCLLARLAPHLSTVQHMSSEKEKENNQDTLKDYADPSWITCRGCCVLMQRLISLPITSMTYQHNALVEWGRALLDVVRQTDHHGAMQRVSAVLQHIATALLLNDLQKSTDGNCSNNGKDIVTGWMSELVQRATSMHALARIRFSHDLPPCLKALMKGIIEAAEQKRKIVKKNMSSTIGKKRKAIAIRPNTVSSTTSSSSSKNVMDDVFNNASNCLYNGCVLPMLTLAANVLATIPARIAAFHVLIRVFETHKLRCFVLPYYNMRDAVELAIGCCQASVPYALSSAAALFWSVVIDVMITTSAGHSKQCTPCTLFLRYPSLVGVFNAHTTRLTTNVLNTNQSPDPISTGLSTPLVLLSLCSQLAPPPPVGDPLALHRQLCGGLVTLCHALLSSPQMLFRLLAAKSLARMIHPMEVVDVVGNVLALFSSEDVSEEGQAHVLTMNTIHGLLLQLIHMKAIHGGTVVWDGLNTRVRNVLGELNTKDSRVMNCTCTAVLVNTIHEWEC